MALRVRPSSVATVIVMVVAGLVLFTLPATSLGSGSSAGARLNSMDVVDPGNLLFVENVGQWPDVARFQVWGGSTGTMWLAEDAIWITMVEKEVQPPRGELPRLSALPISNNQSSTDDASGRAVNVKLSFVGANPHPQIEPLDRGDSEVNYFLSNDPNRWYSAVPVWGGVRYVGLYPGVDLMMGGVTGVWQLGATPETATDQVRLQVEGMDVVALDGHTLQLDAHGLSLSIALPSAPFPYQTSGISAQGESVSLVVQPDPQIPGGRAENPASLLYGTFLGGSIWDFGTALARDGANNAYVTGYTVSSDFPTTPGAFDPSANGDYDTFVAKVTPGGNALAYATFLGGSYQDHGLYIAVDGAYNAYVTGYTESSNFPTTPGAFDTSHNGSDRDWDAFAVKLSPAGTRLIYSTYLGGSGGDQGSAIAVDGTGSAFVAGRTASSNFPITLDAFDTSLGGYGDAFLVKLNSTGSGLVYATYLGGSRSDGGDDVAVDGAGSAYMTGSTFSVDFPTTAGAFDTSLNGDGYNDAFVVKLNSAGSSLIYGTFLGGSESDQGIAIAVDGAGSAYVTGSTVSGNFPTTLGAFDTSHNGVSDVVVVKLNPTGSALAYATFLGGSNSDGGYAIAVDGTGSAYLTGTTSSADFPITLGAFDPTYNGGDHDAFVARLDPTGAGLVNASFLGGSNWDEGHGIAADGAGRVFVAGYTYSANFPTTPGSFDPTFNSGTGSDVFLVKLNLSQAVTPTATPTATPTTTATATPTPTPLPSQTWYVKSDGNDANTCLSPQTACATLQGPLLKPGFQEGDTIRAAVGIFSGTSGASAIVSVSKDAHFSGGWDAATFTVRQGQSEVDGQNQGLIGFQVVDGISATVDHFKIRNCNSAVALHNVGWMSIISSTLSSNGSGIDAYGQVHVTVVDSVVRDNSGPGIYVGHYFSDPGGSLLVDNSSVAGNGRGGINSSGTTTITHSLIALNRGGYSIGAGISVGGDSMITDSHIISNTNQENYGGGIAVYGDALYSATILVARNEIRGNVARTGAGLYLGLDSGPATTTIVEGNLIVDNRTTENWCGGGVVIDGRGATLRNNIIANNTSEYGGGICTSGGNPGESWIVNNTIVDNEGDGIIVTNPFDTVMRLVNNIIAGNSNRGIVGWDDADAQTVGYNLVWGNSHGNYVSIPNMTGFNGNISQPPLLVNRIGGPWHLGACSPAIDAGTNQHAAPFDFDGDTRPYNGEVDIGADEYVGGGNCNVQYLPMIRRR